MAGPEPSEESQDIARKPFVVRAWLDGQISTPEAIQASMLSDDGVVRIWGIYLAGEYAKSLDVKATDLLRVTVT